MNITFYGATREVTGSCFLVQTGRHRILVECGLIQGSHEHERHNRAPFPFSPRDIDAVVLTHAHLDHSGRLPLLVKQGFKGPIFTHRATADLCAILLEDAAYLQEREAEWERRKRKSHNQADIEPLYDADDVRRAVKCFVPLEYRTPTEILSGVGLTLLDAGHILGSSIVELKLGDGERARTVIFSGDLGHRDAPILCDPETVDKADLVVMESTYGDRLHRPWSETWAEIGEIIRSADSGRGNILIPAFAVGRTQELLYAFHQHFDDWKLGNWQIFLDSPLANRATEVYARHDEVYDVDALRWQAKGAAPLELPNLKVSRSTEDSMRINEISSGAIIIAGSGMCTGGRIRYHLKYNVWRENAHVLIAGFQAAGTTGRALVDGARHIHLWGDEVEVKARIHTVGGLSAHADQDGLVQWYGRIKGRPPVVLVHGEPQAMDALQQRLQASFHATVTEAAYMQTIPL
ncbi:MAG TPA: MBL fold metallo-hydrolase [Aromatoleum sp.]|uniref:MBL fold metallo-hydrolase n=1 Tax=Aromatoleum sp. TaxID=2307007 RepID=UPI002B45EC92|nr:MBL fold metallo-hydrolase [Aromatoleum sp.]HJV27167.1 MBL fold metallo-hydrolase [Aromatoleum sp.]